MDPLSEIFEQIKSDVWKYCGFQTKERQGDTVSTLHLSLTWAGRTSDIFDLLAFTQTKYVMQYKDLLPNKMYVKSEFHMFCISNKLGRLIMTLNVQIVPCLQETSSTRVTKLMMRLF